MRILIISFQFPPFKGAGCLRVGKTARYLTEFGHDVRVVTARDQNVPTPTLPLEIDPDRVTYTRWLHVTRLAQLRGPGSAASGLQGGTGSAPLADPPRPSRLRSLARSLLLFPDREVGWFPFGRAAAIDIVREWRPDVIFASAYPVTSLLVGYSVSKATGVPWVAELRDLWADFPYYAHPEWRRRIEKRVERRVLRSAAGLVTVSQPLADRLMDEYRKPTKVVFHGFDAGDYPVPGESPTTPGPTLRLVYTGNLYSRVQDPTPLFEALVGLNGAATLHAYGYRQAWVEAAAERAGATKHVVFHGVVSYSEALAAQAGADALVSFLWNEPEHPGMLLTKNLEYFGAGRPIIAVGCRANGAAELIESRGAGRAVESTDEVATFLGELVAEKLQTGRVAAVPASARSGLSRSEQTRELERFLLDLTGSDERPAT